MAREILNAYSPPSFTCTRVNRGSEPSVEDFKHSILEYNEDILMRIQRKIIVDLLIDPIGNLRHLVNNSANSGSGNSGTFLSRVFPPHSLASAQTYIYSHICHTLAQLLLLIELACICGVVTRLHVPQFSHM